MHLFFTERTHVHKVYWFKFYICTLKHMKLVLLISVQIIRPHIFVILLPYWSSFQMSLSAGNYCLVEAREH